MAAKKPILKMKNIIKEALTNHFTGHGETVPVNSGVTYGIKERKAIWTS
jgi:hypothetical protein